jgi:hypothetical protein
MPATTLIVAGYRFAGFGVPETINGGGAHKLVVHKLPGGTRIIDAMGADDDAISFHGRFRGAGAMNDALLMDAIRRAGKAVSLQYWTLSYTGVVSRFKWDFQRFFEVPYELEFTVISAAQTANTNSPITPDGAIGSDVGLAGTVAGQQ